MALISAILDQYLTAGGESVVERIYIFSPSIEIDDSWKPLKDFIEHRMGVNTEREQVYFDKWDEGGPARHHRAAEEDHTQNQGTRLQKIVRNSRRN